MAPPQFHPIGKRFERLTTKVASGSGSMTMSRYKMYFVVADQDFKLMCRYYWEEGDAGGVYEDFDLQELTANSDDNPSAPSGIKNDIIGREGGPTVTASSTIDIDAFAAEGRTTAHLAILAATSNSFTAYMHDIDQDGPSLYFRLQFKGSPSQKLVGKGFPRGMLYRVGPKRRFSHDDSWIPRF
jgi:hypothetical protein